MKKLIIVLVPYLVLALAGCAGPAKDYTEADALTYNALAPYAVSGIRGDSTLDADQKKRRLNTVKTWRLRLLKAGHEDVPDVVGENP
jgi:hypothetical protein